MKSFVRKFCFTRRLMSTASPSYLKVPDASKFLKARTLQNNYCEKTSFCPPSKLSTLASLGQYVVDLGESDFGSRANFGRGHNHDIFTAGCPTSFDSFLSRLGNIPCNELNTALADSLCVLGSVDCRDLTVRCKGLTASVPEQRSTLIDCVRETHRRATAILSTVFSAARAGNPKVFLANGDHDHMTTAVHSLYAAFNVKPVVVYVDLHADARPSEDGPHSGTWCSEIFESEWAQGAYCVGLNPLSNTQSTIDNLDRHAVVYKPFTWDRIKTGEISLTKAAEIIANELKHRAWRNGHLGGTSNDHPEGVLNNHPGGQFPPVVLSICGDSVQGLPASAGTETIGYSVDEIYGFIAGVCSRVSVSCMTVAETKTSLEPHKASSVGEFLTQSLFLYHLTQTNLRAGR